LQACDANARLDLPYPEIEFCAKRQIQQQKRALKAAPVELRAVFL
jgi:hypothetical protein